MTALRHPLPDHLYWLTEKVEGLVRTAAFLKTAKRHQKTGVPERVATVGSTIISGWPDLPQDTPWALGLDIQYQWMNHVSDGESFVAQINLAEVPDAVRVHFPTLPKVGVVWVTIEGRRGWRIDGHAYFDARDASTISWRARQTSVAAYRAPAAVIFDLEETMTCATDETLPEIASDWREGGLASDYDEWWGRHYAGRGREEIQMGGWIHPIQGDADEVRKTVFMEFSDMHFGDAGAVYLHHCPERGFFVTTETH